jgi:outer membrane protein assembly factor BamB
MGRRLFGALGIVLLALLCGGALPRLLLKRAGLQLEWRGGYVPTLTRGMPTSDYDAVERDRAGHAGTPVTASASEATNAYWTGFRGPRRDGHYDERPILTNWPSTGLRLLWRQPVGGGFGSFAIAKGLVFTIEQRRDEEVVAAYELASGREVWTHRWKADFKGTNGDEGPRTTPTYSEGRLYALGALGELRCLEAATGKLVWSRNVATENRAPPLDHGVSASPLVSDEKLIVLAGAGHGHSVVCYDKRDGKPLWGALDDMVGYVSPMLVTLAGQSQVAVCTTNRTVGLGLEDGKVLWGYDWRLLQDQLPITQPVLLGTNRFLLSAGYGTGCAAVEVARTASGLAARTLWRNTHLKNKFASSVFWEGNIYGLDEDILTCLGAETGDRKWKDGRYGYGQLILASGHLVILTDSGTLALVKATPLQHEELARFQAIRGKTWNPPAMAEGKLLVRNAAEMACFDISTRAD